MSFHFARNGRSTIGAATLAAVWLALVAAWFVLDAAWWIVGLIWLATLPLLRDLVLAPEAGLALDDGNLAWWSGRRRGTVATSEIDHVRLDRRLDGTMRATLVLVSGKRIRLPQESQPPPDRLEQVLADCGIATQRRAFSLL